MTSRVIIIHRWDADPFSDWYQSLKEQVQERGLEVFIPAMPNPQAPTISDWVAACAEVVGEDISGTVFVGHSIGCQTILRFLEKNDVMATGCVFVAPWFSLQNLEDEESEIIARPWIQTPINFERVTKKTGKVISFLSDTDPFVPYKNTEEKLIQDLHSEVITVASGGHFTDEEGCKKFPEIYEAIKKVI